MSLEIVVDASVVVKLLLQEPLSAAADALYRDATLADRRLVGPSLLFGEVANAVYQRFRRRDISGTDADAAIIRFGLLPIAPVVSSTLYEEAYTFARTHQLPSVYDSHYVVLARSLETDLWTDDRPLLNSVRTVAPWVRWIGDYPTPG